MKHRVVVLSIVLGLVLLPFVPILARAATLPPWQPRNSSGFGDSYNQVVSSLATFNGQIYAGTSNVHGAEVRRSADGSTWPLSNQPGFSPAFATSNGIVYDMLEYNGWLYAATGSWTVHAVAGQIWRTRDGATWQQVTGAWEANVQNAGVTNLAVFGNKLFMTTFNPSGLQIWASNTGNSNDWVQVATNIAASPSYKEVTGLTVFKGYLYAAVEGQSAGPGAQVWRTSDGISWSVVVPNGFGSPANYQTGGWGIYNGYLYVGTLNNTTGGQLFRSLDGTAWTPVVTNGFAPGTGNYKIEGLATGVGLFAFTDNLSGTQVWWSTDGVTWQQTNVSGFGASNLAVALWSNSAALFGLQLFVGTWNQTNGGQIWSVDLSSLVPNKLYLPAAMR